MMIRPHARLYALAALAVLCTTAALLPAQAATTTISTRAVRVPVKALSTTNLTLSGPQTVDGVAVVAGDLVGALGQSDGKNAVYVVQSTAWKAADPGIGTGLEVYALQGGANGNALYGCDTAGTIVWGTTTTAFTRKSTSGASFNPAAPGTIGVTTPGVVHASDLYLATATASPVAGKLLLNATASQSNLVVTAGGGSRLSIGQEASTATANAAVRVVAITLANDATYDFNNTGFGGSAVIATDSGTVSATIAFSTAAVTTTGGLTFANFSTTLGTSSKLNVAASGGKVRFENKTGGSINVVAKITMFVAG